ncbi:MAG: archease [Methanocalculus sp. MSAO_Arc1]|uniref:archease n=1 Tax=Methanocalculus TaxID=71151 RepID=UPI000FF26E0A|nr:MULTISPECIES: archease [unclassified Methanocalculus]MCP1661727.1 SHS2 domain-containing protein [Methanocalculus sp. AMF5]RQD79400.1 MAG: archease [Methanocalculus sp. MSAO_Arc1]
MSIEELEHTADVRIRITAETREELFARASEALFGILYTGECISANTRSFQVSADSDEDLLWEFLSELIYISETEFFVVCKTEIRFTEDGLCAKIHGEPFVTGRHGGGREVKGISYSELSIESVEDGFSALIIFDV